MTQQTIRVPMGYPLPGMQLHVVAGHGNPNQHYAHFARHQQHQTQDQHQHQHQQQQQQQQHQTQQQLHAGRIGYGYATEKPAVKYTERGVPEGAASVSQSDCNTLIPITSGIQCSSNNTHTSTTSSVTSTGIATSQPTQPPSVYYAMNI